MLHDLDQVDGILAGVGCIAWTTVKVRGVSPLYGRDWAEYARTWNTLLRDHVEGTVLDWNAIARSHPGYFLGDGLHMSGAGRVAYRALPATWGRSRLSTVTSSTTIGTQQQELLRWPHW